MSIQPNDVIQLYDLMMSADQARRAIRRGDLAGAERWFKLADRAASIAQRLHAVARAEAPPRSRFPRNPP
jgi:hypothetical protein